MRLEETNGIIKQFGKRAKYVVNSGGCRCGGGIQYRGEDCHSWKGGRLVTAKGYIYILLQPDDLFYSMAYRGYVYEHRLVVAKALGRCLLSWEIVHHKHDKYPAGSIEDKQDNRYPENLQLVTDERHNQITILENKIKHLEERLKAYEKKC